jgi:hypothetical protein
VEHRPASSHPVIRRQRAADGFERIGLFGHYRHPGIRVPLLYSGRTLHTKGIRMCPEPYPSQPRPLPSGSKL